MVSMKPLADKNRSPDETISKLSPHVAHPPLAEDLIDVFVLLGLPRLTSLH